MKTTHRVRDEPSVEVTAWQFSRAEPIPVWVARKWHRISGDGWTAVFGNEIMEARAGDRTVFMDFLPLPTKFPHEQFTRLFEPIPAPAFKR